MAAVSHVRSLGCKDIEFSPEDAGRSDPTFLYRILGEVIKVREAGKYVWPFHYHSTRELHSHFSLLRLSRLLL